MNQVYDSILKLIDSLLDYITKGLSLFAAYKAGQNSVESRLKDETIDLYAKKHNIDLKNLSASEVDQLLEILGSIRKN